QAAPTNPTSRRPRPLLGARRRPQVALLPLQRRLRRQPEHLLRRARLAGLLVPRRPAPQQPVLRGANRHLPLLHLHRPLGHPQPPRPPPAAAAAAPPPAQPRPRPRRPPAGRVPPPPASPPSPPAAAPPARPSAAAAPPPRPPRAAAAPPPAPAGGTPAPPGRAR